MMLTPCFSPDGRRLVSGSDDDTIKIWNVETGQEEKTLQGHTDYVVAVAFSPDGKSLASASDDGMVKIWDLGEGRLVSTLKGHLSYVWSVAFSPDGLLLASGSRDTTIRIWDLETGKTVKTLRGHTSYVWSLCFSPDGRSLASASDDGTIRLWDLQEGKEAPPPFKGKTKQVCRVVKGAVMDVVVDIRKSSPNFGQWFAYEINEVNKTILWIPPGFAHGIYVLSEWAEILYKTTDFYAP